MIEPTPWDYCEITYRLVDERDINLAVMGWFRFVAVVRGPNGRYTAATSPKLPLPHLTGVSRVPQQNNPSHQNAHQELVQTLRRYGWQPLAVPGEQWWIKRFRRKARPPRTFWQRLRARLEWLK